MGPYRFCSDGYPTTLSILFWSYLILSDTHMCIHLRIHMCTAHFLLARYAWGFLKITVYDLLESANTNIICSPNNPWCSGKCVQSWETFQLLIFNQRVLHFPARFPASNFTATLASTLGTVMAAAFVADF